MTPAASATKAANRAAILAAGRDVFSAHGYDAAGVRDIVRRTDLASGTFYNYFPDKASIFRAIVEDTARGGAPPRPRRPACRPTAPRSFVEGGFRAFFEFIASDPDTFAFLRRNLGTIREQFEDAVLPGRDRRARGRPARRDRPRRAAARGRRLLRARDDRGRAWSSASSCSSARPPDVEGATGFATALFAGGLARLAAGATLTRHALPPSSRVLTAARAARRPRRGAAPSSPSASARTTRACSPTRCSRKLGAKHARVVVSWNVDDAENDDELVRVAQYLAGAARSRA